MDDESPRMKHTALVALGLTCIATTAVFMWDSFPQWYRYLLVYGLGYLGRMAYAWAERSES